MRGGDAEDKFMKGCSGEPGQTERSGGLKMQVKYSVTFDNNESRETRVFGNGNQHLRVQNRTGIYAQTLWNIEP